MITNPKIIIKGIPERLPKITSSGDIIMIFKISLDEQITKSSKPINLYCRILISQALWETVSGDVKESTYYIIEGLPDANVNSKGLAFINVFCNKIDIINNVLKDESSAESFKFPGILPENTDEVIPVSDINVPEYLRKPTTAKTKALNYFKEHGTFLKPILVKKHTMTLVGGYASYLLAKDLNIQSIPVSYNLSRSPVARDEHKIASFRWYKPDEVTELNLKDIILTEDIHLNVQNFVFSINLKEIAEIKSISTPIAVRSIGDGKYSLVTGAARYFAAKILDIEKLPAVITELSHDEFIKSRFPKYSNTNTDNDSSSDKKPNTPNKSKTLARVEGETLMSLITIPTSFANTIPRREKITETIVYYKKHEKFDKPVVIKGDSNLLVDGYKRYLAAQEMGHSSIWTIKIK